MEGDLDRDNGLWKGKSGFGVICFGDFKKGTVQYLYYLNKQRMNTQQQLFGQKIKLQEEKQMNQQPNLGTGFKNKVFQFGFGQWTDKQIYKYFLFVYHNRQKFHSKSMRKSVKIFKLMAKFVKTRNSCQCRTHHQNVLKKSRNLDHALKRFMVSHPCFSRKYDLIKNSLKILDDIEFCQDTSTVIRQAKIESPSDTDNENSSQKQATSIYQQPLTPPNYPEAYPESSPYPTYPTCTKQQIRIQKILQCQYLFTEWINRINELSALPYY